MYVTLYELPPVAKVLEFESVGSGPTPSLPFIDLNGYMRMDSVLYQSDTEPGGGIVWTASAQANSWFFQPEPGKFVDWNTLKLIINDFRWGGNGNSPPKFIRVLFGTLETIEGPIIREWVDIERTYEPRIEFDASPYAYQSLFVLVAPIFDETIPGYYYLTLSFQPGADYDVINPQEPEPEQQKKLPILVSQCDITDNWSGCK